MIKIQKALRMLVMGIAVFIIGQVVAQTYEVKDKLQIETSQDRSFRWDIWNDLIGMWTAEDSNAKTTYVSSYSWNSDRSEIDALVVNSGSRASYQLDATPLAFVRVGDDGIETLAEKRADGFLHVPTGGGSSFTVRMDGKDKYVQTFHTGTVRSWRRLSSSEEMGFKQLMLKREPMFGPMQKLIGGLYWNEEDSTFLMARWTVPGYVMEGTWTNAIDLSTRPFQIAYNDKDGVFMNIGSLGRTGRLMPDGSFRFEQRGWPTINIRLFGDRLEWTSENYSSFLLKSPEDIDHYNRIDPSQVESIRAVAIAKAERRRIEREAQEREERRAESERKREERQAYESGISGIYNAIQATGAIINEDAERTQAELDATLARAAAQGEANQQAQLRQQQESQEQASAAQQHQSEQAERAAEDAESNRLRQQNAANLAKAKGYLQQAIDNDLDPAIVEGMREGVNTLEEALREDNSPSYSAGSVNNDDTDDLAEQQAAEAQANAKREADAKAAEEAKASRQAEAEAKAAERRASEELAKKEQQQKLANHLAAEQRGIRLRALTCPSGKGSYFVAGTRPNVSPKVANCISVQFEARCPGTQRGQGVIDTFQNYVGGDSCVGDTIRIPELACPADRVGVDVLDVATCS